MNHAAFTDDTGTHILAANLYGPDTLQTVHPNGALGSLSIISATNATRDMVIYHADSTNFYAARAGYWNDSDELYVIPRNAPERARTIALDGPKLSVSIHAADLTGSGKPSLLVARDDNLADGTLHPDVYYVEVPPLGANTAAREFADSHFASTFIFTADLNGNDLLDAVILQTHGAMLCYTNNGSAADPFAGIQPQKVEIDGIPMRGEWLPESGKVVISVHAQTGGGQRLLAFTTGENGLNEEPETVVTFTDGPWVMTAVQQPETLLLVNSNGDGLRLEKNRKQKLKPQRNQ